MNSHDLDNLEKILFGFTLNMISEAETLSEIIKIVRGAEKSMNEITKQIFEDNT